MALLGRRRRACLLAALGLALLSLPSVVAAQSSSTSGSAAGVGIDGWTSRIDGQPDAARALPSPLSDQRADTIGGGAASESIESTFAKAAMAQNEGRLEEAQRLFERVVASEPYSALAARARRELGKLYGRDGSEGPSRPAVVRGTEAPQTTREITTEARMVPATGSGGTRADADAPASSPSGAPVPKPWRRTAIRTERFEALMRSETGDRIFFATDSAEVGARARAVIERQARWLARFPELLVVVEGHADEPGNVRRNDELSVVRAEKVREMLEAAGVAASRIDVEALGQAQPVARCDQPLCKAQNRRAVTRLFVVLPERGSARGAARTDNSPGTTGR
ncbi:MAG: OmpA family protein [Hyphomicrobiaceae bacterium]